MNTANAVCMNVVYTFVFFFPYLFSTGIAHLCFEGPEFPWTLSIKLQKLTDDRQKTSGNSSFSQRWLDWKW